MNPEPSSRSTLQSVVRFAMIPATVSIFAVALVAYLFLRSSAELSNVYADYNRSGKSYSDAAFLVGSNNNPLRIELNQVLAEVLGKTMTPAERLERVRRGRELLGESQKQIDAIGDNGEVSSSSIELLDSTSRGIANLYARPNAAKVVELSKARGAMIADIRGLSYKTNYYISQIFDRIDNDGGELTQEHIRELNARIPELEAEFDRRSNLYTDLESINYKIQNEVAGR